LLRVWVIDHPSPSNQYQLRLRVARLSQAIAGTPEQCIQQLSKYVDDGIHYFFLLFPDPIPGESLELFASEVMSYFA